MHPIRYKILIIVVICTLTGIGCASNKANRKLKRANRLIAQAEQLGAVITPDTIYKKIPVYIDSVVVDSIFVTTEGKPIYIEKERLRITFIDLPGDSVFIEGKCDSLTIIKEVPVTVTKEIKTGLSVLVVVQWSILALIIGGFLAKIFWK
jgi:hypothetical protein